MIIIKWTKLNRKEIEPPLSREHSPAAVSDSPDADCGPQGHQQELNLGLSLVPDLFWSQWKATLI